jgi:DNA-binding transcriptional MerR regulator
MNNLSYSLKELCQVANVTERTVRFYIKEGLLPPPSGAKAFSRYSYEHVLRLQVIHLLKERFLPLKEIKKLLEGKTIPELESLAKQVSVMPVLNEDTAMLTQEKPTDMSTLTKPTPPFQPAISFNPPNNPFSGFYTVTSPVQQFNPVQKFGRPGYSQPGFLNPPPLFFEQPTEYDTEPQKWERVNLAPGIELHVEGKLAEENRQEINDLIQEIKRLLDR